MIFKCTHLTFSKKDYEYKYWWKNKYWERQRKRERERQRLKWTCHYSLFAHLNQLRLNLQYKYIILRNPRKNTTFYLLKISFPNMGILFHLYPQAPRQLVRNTIIVCYFVSSYQLMFHLLDYTQNFILKKWTWPSSRIPCTVMLGESLQDEWWSSPFFLLVWPCTVLSLTLCNSHVSLPLGLWIHCILPGMGFCKYCLLYLERSSCTLIASVTP